MIRGAVAGPGGTGWSLREACPGLLFLWVPTGMRSRRAAGNELADFAGLRAGTLRIGTFPTVSASLLPTAVMTFREAHPDIRLTARSARLAGLWPLLENREIELSLMWDYAWSRIDRTDAVVTPLLDDALTLLVSDRYPLAGRRSATLADVADDPWITRADNHPVADALDRSCRAAGFAPQIAYEAHDYQEAQAMVATGIGVALAPTLALEGSIRAGVRVLSLRPPAAEVVRGLVAESVAAHAREPDGAASGDARSVEHGAPILEPNHACQGADWPTPPLIRLRRRLCC